MTLRNLGDPHRTPSATLGGRFGRRIEVAGVICLTSVLSGPYVNTNACSFHTDSATLVWFQSRGRARDARSRLSWDGLAEKTPDLVDRIVAGSRRAVTRVLHQRLNLLPKAFGDDLMPGVARVHPIV
jgi:hypothetical protein